MSPAHRVMARALVRWQHAAGPYWPYVCAAPFLGYIDSAAIPPRSLGAASASAAVVEAIDALPERPRGASFADLPILATLPAVSALEDRGFTVVPVVQRWVAQDAVLPCTELQRLLAAYQPRRAGLRGVVFLLDGERGGPPTGSGRRPAARRFDNRYLYPICRFPPARFLLNDGVEAVFWLSQAGIAPDLHEYAQSLLDAGLPLHERSISAPLYSSLPLRERGRE